MIFYLDCLSLTDVVNQRLDFSKSDQEFDAWFGLEFQEGLKMNDDGFKLVEELVDRLIDGDESARHELIQVSYERLKKLARKMLRDFPTVRRWEETDDVFQGVAVRLWQSLAKIQPENSRHFFNLAALQVRRELIELARSLNGPLGLARNYESHARPDASQETGSQNEIGTDTYDAANLAKWGEFHEKVELLDDEEREVFALIWYQGLSQEAVSRLLHVSQKTVSRRWQKSCRRLDELLEGGAPD